MDSLIPYAATCEQRSPVSEYSLAPTLDQSKDNYLSLRFSYLVFVRTRPLKTGRSVEKGKKRHEDKEATQH